VVRQRHQFETFHSLNTYYTLGVRTYFEVMYSINALLRGDSYSIPKVVGDSRDAFVTNSL
jgi:hypothetical protein